MRTECPSEDTLSAFACGGDLHDRTCLVAHLDVCDVCRRIVSTVARTSAPQLARGSQPDYVEIDVDDDRASGSSTGTGPRVGRYVLRHMLGEGAMGVVHLAYDPKLRRHVALKLMRPDADDGAQGQRLYLEAQAAAQLIHPNTVAVFDVGVEAGQPYVAMEYVEGTTVAEWLGSEPGWREALEVMCLAGDGLVAAHRAGLVHRDFKLGNILLGNEPRSVKVSDFGLARFSDASLSSITAYEDALLLPRSRRAQTSAGAFVGTPAYTAPELYATGAASEASDQFAFGVALYRALYGVRPFRGPTLYATYEAICYGPAPEPPADTEVPATLWPVIARSLAKNPGERHPSMADMLAALRQASHGLVNERCPFPGLVSFGEEDASMYFGRSRELAEITGRLRDHTLAAVIGPSGSGKSSFVRALVVPASRAAGSEVVYVRPGAHPIRSLATALAPLVHEDLVEDLEHLEGWLEREPRHAAGILLAHARRRRSTVVLVVDQLEELYTQSAPLYERRAFALALAAMAEDVSLPLRLVVSLRSDFLTRVGECGPLIDRISEGFLFMNPPSRSGLIEALVKPLAAVGYHLEDVSIAEQIADELDGHPGAFPLLQFIAGQLWEARDPSAHTITRASVEAIGTLANALAAHGDRVLTSLSERELAVARSVLIRLVTPERTRAQRSIDELLVGAQQIVTRVIEHLVRERLVVAHGNVIEIAHESLITTWPTLCGWLDDAAGDARLISDIGAAARRWDAAGRPDGYVWTGEPARRAAELVARSRQTNGGLATTERAFVEASARVLRRGARMRRIAVFAAISISTSIAVAASVALVVVRRAHAAAEESAELAREQTDRVRVVENQLQQSDGDLDRTREEADAMARLARTEQAARETATATANAQLAVANRELEQKNHDLREALRRAEAANHRSELAARALEEQVAQNTFLLQERSTLIEKLKADNARLRTRLPE